MRKKTEFQTVFCSNKICKSGTKHWNSNINSVYTGQLVPLVLWGHFFAWVGPPTPSNFNGWIICSNLFSLVPPLVSSIHILAPLPVSAYVRTTAVHPRVTKSIRAQNTLVSMSKPHREELVGLVLSVGSWWPCCALSWTRIEWITIDKRVIQLGNSKCSARTDKMMRTPTRNSRQLAGLQEKSWHNGISGG